MGLHSAFAFVWDGEAMLPAGSLWAARCDKEFVVGLRYQMQEYQDRSAPTHNHQFAWLHDAWQNLSENIADLYPTDEHLRKRALIDCGYYDETIIDCGSAAAAIRVASHLRHKDDFALVIVRGRFVIERTAKSQSRRAMDAKTFQESKQKIMDHIEDLIGLERGSLAQNAGKAA